MAVAAVLVMALAVLGGAATLGTGYVYAPAGLPDVPATLVAAFGSLDERVAADTVKALDADHRRLSRAWSRLAPKGRFIVVDQTHNRLVVKEDDSVLLFAVCSAGSGLVLRDTTGGQEWVFDTPRGRFEVLSRSRNPVWRKPDWAFVEEGLPVPADPSKRFEYGVLGEYALNLGDGYLIHGTLYERLLGRAVTHGCIRLGRDDLRAVYAMAPVGTPVFIF